MRFHTYGAALFLLCLLVFSGCKKKEPGGDDVLTDSQQEVISTDTLTIRACTAPQAAIPSDETLLQLLGSYHDPVFGLASSGVYTQVRLSDINVDFGKIDNAIIDSLILTLAYRDYYGKNDPQQFSVYQLNEPLHVDSFYSSNRSFSYDSLPKATLSGFVPVSTSSGLLRFQLSSDLGEFLLEGGANYSNNESFLKFFNGFYIRAENPSQAAGEGGILYLDLLHADSRLMLHYTDDDGKKQSYEYYINDHSARLSHFEHDYSGTVIETLLNDKGKGKEKLYIQSMGGVRGQLYIPYLKNLISQYEEVAIIKAELSFFTEDNMASEYPLHQKLYLVGINAEGNSIFLADEGESHYGGSYDATTGKYTFNITRHMQSLMNDLSAGKDSNFGLRLMGAGSAVNANRTILQGTDRNSERIKLTLSFTPL